MISSEWNMNNVSWKERIEQFKIPIGLSVLGTVLILGGIFASGLGKSNSSNRSFPKESLVNTEKLLSVDVSGAVKNPGVYQLKGEPRIRDAILAAGGFAETANTEYISKYLNMAQKLSDGTKVFVPAVGEIGIGGGNAGIVAGANVEAKVNINTATQAEIEALPGIGPVTAGKIISGRQYSAIEDLLNKKIVSKAVFEKIKDSVTLY